MDKVKSLAEAVANICDGQSIMVAGFLSAGAPVKLVDGILEKGVKDLTLIANDTSTPDHSLGKLIVGKRASRVISSHVGKNKETGRQMTAGELDVELVPQGTLAERIRCAGAGLGGFLTPTGVGTSVEEGKQKITVDGREFLIEKPIRADVALLRAWKADKIGNLVFKGAGRNFNPMMAMAADLVIAEAEIIVEVGEIHPDDVVVPGTLVDVVIQA